MDSVGLLVLEGANRLDLADGGLSPGAAFEMPDGMPLCWGLCKPEVGSLEAKNQHKDKCKTMETVHTHLIIVIKQHITKLKLIVYHDKHTSHTCYKRSQVVGAWYSRGLKCTRASRGYKIFRVFDRNFL